jgi:hypothetical protein
VIVMTMLACLALADAATAAAVVVWLRRQP